MKKKSTSYSNFYFFFVAAIFALQIAKGANCIADDAGITAVVVPSPLCGIASVQATIYNYGSNNLTSIRVDWTVTPGGPQPQNTFALNIPPGTDITLTLGTFNFATSGASYSIMVTTSLPNGVADNNTSNDAFTQNVVTGLSGNYNVGTGGHYTTLTNAVNALNSAGVCGPVTFLLTDANYTTSEAFPIKINAINGSSATNTVTVKPAPSKTVLIEGNPGIYSLTTRALLELRGVTYFICDGSNTANGTSKDLTISNNSTNGTDDVATIMLKWSSSYNIIKNCIVKGSAQNWYSQGVIHIGDTAGASVGRNNYNSILHNDIRNSTVVLPQCGVDIGFVSSSVVNPQIGNVISGNRIFNFNANGVYILYNNSNWSVLNNEIYQEPGIYGNYDVSGINENAAYDNPAIVNYRIMGNFIHDLRSSYASSSTINATISGISSMGDGTSGNSLVANNIVVLKENCKSSYRGIYDPSAVYSLTLNVVYNSVYIGGQYNNLGTSNGSSAAFWRDGNATATTSFLTLKDNILINVRTDSAGRSAGAPSIYSTPLGNYGLIDAKETSGLTFSDYNDIYVGNATNKKFAWRRNIGYGDFWDQWNTLTGRDANSIHVGTVGSQNGILPNFIDLANNNLHLDPSSNCVLDGKGTPVFGITKDIDSLTTGETRNAITPDIGADEFTSTPLPPPTITISNDTLKSSHASFYQWYRNGVLISGATDSIYVTTQAGTYSVAITDQFGCTATSVLIPVHIGLNEFVGIDLIKVYPNPAGIELWIQTDSNKEANFTLEICNVFGEAVYSHEITLSIHPFKIDISNFSAGVYFVQLCDGKAAYLTKIVKQ